MAKVPDFEFDYTKVEGMDVTEAMKALMDQMAAHYNKYIKPAPVLFGGVQIKPPLVVGIDPAKPGADRSEELVLKQPAGTTPPPAQVAHDVKKMREWDIKPGTEVGLKGGYVMNGVTVEGVEVFDTLKPEYGPNDTYIECESGAYQLEKK